MQTKCENYEHQLEDESRKVEAHQDMMKKIARLEGILPKHLIMRAYFGKGHE